MGRRVGLGGCRSGRLMFSYTAYTAIVSSVTSGIGFAFVFMVFIPGPCTCTYNQIQGLSRMKKNGSPWVAAESVYSTDRKLTS